jgi:hypothetical protein
MHSPNVTLRRMIRKRPITFALALALSATAALGTTPAPVAATSLPTDVRPSLSSAKDDIEAISKNGCRVGLKRTAVRTDCIYGDRYGKKKVALVGDSHAAHLFPALNKLAKARHWRLDVQTKVSCRFVDLPIVSRELGRRYTECEQWRLNVVAYLRANPQHMVVYVVARAMAVVKPEHDDPAVQGHALARLMKQIPGKQVVIVDTPTSYHDVPACLAENRDHIEACGTDRNRAFSWRHLILEKAAVGDVPGATLVNLSKQICPPAEKCQAVHNGMIVWRDYHHLTRTFSKSLALALGAKLPLP